MKKLLFALIGIFLFSVLLRVATINQIGRTWDELEYVDEGYKMIELYKKGDIDNRYFYLTYDHPPLVKYLYGITAHFDAQKHLSNGTAILNYDFTYSRLLSAVVFSFGVVLIVVLGWRLFSPIVGITAGIILAMLPFSLGLSQLVTTESWKILIYPAVIYSYYVLIQQYSLKKLIMAGVLTGLALQIKQSDALLILIFILMYISYYQLHLKKKHVAFLNKTSLGVIAIGIISVLVFILFWPQGLIHYKEVSAINHELWNVKFSPNPLLFTLAPPEIFFGELRLVPVFYYVVYFFISIPILIIFFFFIGVIKINNERKWAYYTLAIWFVVPFLMSLYSWRQHGLRYIIEIYPAIALIAAVGFNALVSRITKSERKKFIYFFPVIFYLFIILFQTKPYYLDYFNEVVGGTHTVYATRMFQQGWWGQGIGEAGKYLIAHASKGSVIGLALSPDTVLPKDTSFTYTNWEAGKKYDYVVVNYYHIIRDGFDDSIIKKNYTLLYEVKVDNSPLVFIYKKK
jgi:4-amino-4-deoxy-L-arabinose transferase-like glycosyltransferase